MSYHVLARKWRPSSFQNLVGQQHVVKALTYALDHDKVHHAYLFTGTRGVGKTSIARIFAKSLNCEQGPTSQPCGVCEACQEIDGGRFVDLIEVDAASRTGVDETRNLIESVAYLPAKGRYKVYLIDEVHMFSKSSFNALLKTLEEPPAYVKFILATTDPEKLPVTILSRCLQFNLKSLSVAQITGHLTQICQQENITYDANALSKLAHAGDGSMRDTLSLVDQALAYGQGQLHIDSVTELLGTVHPADTEAILLAIVTADAAQLQARLQMLNEYDLDARQLLLDLLAAMQALAWQVNGMTANPPLSPALQIAAQSLTAPLVQLWYDILRRGLEEVSRASDKMVALEMTLIRLLAFIPSDLNLQPLSSMPMREVDIDSTANDQLANAGINTSIEIPVEPSIEASLGDAPINTSLPPWESLETTPLKVKTESEKPVMTPKAGVLGATIPSSLVNLPADLSAAYIEEAVESAKTANALTSETLGEMATLAVSESVLSGTPIIEKTATNVAEDMTGSASDPSLEVFAEPEEIKEGSDSVASNAKDSAMMEFATGLECAEASQVEDSQVEEKPSQTNKEGELSETIEQQLTSADNQSMEQVAATQDFRWSDFLETLELSDFTRVFAEAGILTLDDTYCAQLTISPQHSVLQSPQTEQELQVAIQQKLGADWRLQVVQGEVSGTPAELLDKQQQSTRAAQIDLFNQQPFTHYLLEKLQAKVLTDTIQSTETDKK